MLETPMKYVRPVEIQLGFSINRESVILLDEQQGHWIAQGFSGEKKYLVIATEFLLMTYLDISYIPVISKWYKQIIKKGAIQNETK
jgi:hypothetical protein